jgi:hypothetical protein
MVEILWKLERSGNPEKRSGSGYGLRPKYSGNRSVE